MVPEREHLDGTGRSLSPGMVARRPALRRSGLQALATAGSLIALLTVQGCSATPDWANPMHWYDSTVSAVTGNDEADTAADTVDATDAGSTPKLSTVPARPAIDPASERTKLREGLSADRAAAQYTAQDLRAEPEGGSESTPAAAAPAAVPTVTAAAGSQETGEGTQTPPAATVAPRAAVASAPSAPVQTAAPASASASTPAAAPAPAGQAAADNRAVATAPVAAPAAMTVQQVYEQQLRASAATSTSVPANTTFAASTARPIGQFAAAVPPVVQQAYNGSLAGQPRAQPYRPADQSRNPASQTAFSAAGSRLGATIDYHAGSATLNAADRDTLRQLVQEYRARGGILRVIGYAGADDVGNSATGTRPMRQFDVAQARATGVAQALTKLGAKARDVFVEARDASGSQGSEAHTAQIFLEN